MVSPQITISENIQKACPQLRLGILTGQIVNSPSSDELWLTIDGCIAEIEQSGTLENVNKLPEIAASRAVYKLLGKDPNRYRPSAEALRRRVMRHIDLYRVNTLVDAVNLISLQTTYSIGAFDLQKIKGDINMGVGENDEDFEAIGRGMLNISGLPVFRDSNGGIGTPTSDNERTKVNTDTTQLLLIINDYSGIGQLQEALDYSIGILKKHNQLFDFKQYIIDCKNTIIQ